MDAYTDFAKVYDTFMDETPYPKWCKRVDEAIKNYGISRPLDKKQVDSDGPVLPGAVLESERNLVVDLGCGTGTLTELLADLGYDMVGIDNSQEMLSIAMEKKALSGHEILYLLQDMRELELYSTVGTVISVCDSLNYILEEEELEQVFRLVNNYLYPQGIFIFDFNTVYKYETVIGDTTIAENREECSFIWENYYHREEEINEYDLTIFAKDPRKDYFQKSMETHYQRGYRLEQIKALVEKAGLEWIEAKDADTEGEVTKETERVFVITREHGKRIDK